MKKAWLGLSVILPIASVAYLLASTIAVEARGTYWKVRIGGYDPTDLLRGQYLRYRPVWEWEPGSGESDVRGACLCLTRKTQSESPLVRREDCALAKACDGWFYGDQLLNLQKFFLPETAAKDVERVVQDPATVAEIVVVTSASGKAMARELLLNGKKWSEAIGASPP